MATDKVDPVGVEHRLGYKEFEELMVYVVRNRTLFQLAKLSLSPAHFTGDFEAGHRLMWRSVVEYYNKHGNLPSQSALVAIVSDASEVEYEITEDVRDDIISFIEDFAYSVDGDVLDEKYGRSLLQRFLRDREFVDPLKAYVGGLNGHSPADLPAFLKELTDRAGRVEIVRHDPIVLADSTSLDDDFKETRTTGWSFLDDIMDGGRSEGEVYLLAGCMGSGKSTLATQMCVGACRYDWFQLRDYGETPGHCVYFTWETPPGEIMRKFYACAARVPTDRLRKFPRSEWNIRLSTSTKADTMLPYERELFGAGKVLGERERLEDEARPLARTMMIADMRGRPGTDAGSRYLDEVVMSLDSRLRSKEVDHFSVVVIDYASLVCERYVQHLGQHPSETYHYLKRIGDDVVCKIAEPYKCSVLLVQQLSGQSNKKTSGARQNTADTEGCSTMARNADYAFAIGNKNNDGLLRFDVSKTRRSDGRVSTHVLQLTPYSRLICVDDRYCLDPSGGGIIEKVTASKLADLDGATEGAAPRPRAAGGISW